MSRILLSAYACEPGKGSEPAVGWMWASELSAMGHDVWVITREANRSSIEAGMLSLDSNVLHFAYCDLPRWARGWKKLPGAIYLYYFLWQWLAFLLAKKLNRTHRFDRVHHVTLVSLRAPSLMGWLGIPFFLGPVSGGECVPRPLRRNMTRAARAFEFARDCANRLTRFDPLMRAAFRQAERIYLASSHSLELVPQKHHDKCQVHLAVGLTLEQLGFSRRNLPAGRHELRCLYAGRLLQWKGLHLVLMAMQRLKTQATPISLTIVGDGPAKSSLRSLAEHLGVASRITWCQWLPHEQLQSKLHEYDAFVFPSLRDSGGMAVLEALAHGLPVVCTDLGGPGVIVNNRCGRVVVTNGKSVNEIVDDLAASIRELAENPGLRQSLSIGARRRAWDFQFRRLVEEIYPAAPVNDRVLSESVTA